MPVPMQSQAGEGRGGLCSEGNLTFQLAIIWHMKSDSLLAHTCNHEFAWWPGLWADPVPTPASPQVAVFIFFKHQEHISVKGEPLFLWLYVPFLGFGRISLNSSKLQRDFCESGKQWEQDDASSPAALPGIFLQTFSKRFPWHTFSGASPSDIWLDAL